MRNNPWYHRGKTSFASDIFSKLKDVDELAKLAPVWDFDWAFGNNNMYSIWTYEPESWHTSNNYFTNE